MWTDEQQANARSEGWEIVDTIDNGKQVAHMRIYSCGRFKSHREAEQHVLNQARRASRFHIEALRVVAGRSRK
jgi:hypothetical protein